jgi:hypothetical protein
MRARLVRLLTSLDDNITRAISDLLMTLCRDNGTFKFTISNTNDVTVDRLIKYTGYGNACGMLAARGLMNPPNVKQGDAADDTSSDDEAESYQNVKNQYV